jgi:hypothetical protein
LTKRYTVQLKVWTYDYSYHRVLTLSTLLSSSSRLLAVVCAVGPAVVYCLTCLSTDSESAVLQELACQNDTVSSQQFSSVLQQSNLKSKAIQTVCAADLQNKVTI